MEENKEKSCDDHSSEQSHSSFKFSQEQENLPPPKIQKVEKIEKIEKIEKSEKAIDPCLGECADKMAVSEKDISHKLTCDFKAKIL